MFKKPGPPAGNLTDRIRRISEKTNEPAPGRPALSPSKGRAPRDPVFKHGVLILEDGRKFSVALKNLSETGAKVEFHNRMHLPERVMVAEPTLKLRRWARVVWQDDHAAGLAFIDE